MTTQQVEDLQRGEVCTAHGRGGRDGVDPGNLTAVLDIPTLTSQRWDERW